MLYAYQRFDKERHLSLVKIHNVRFSALCQRNSQFIIELKASDSVPFELSGSKVPTYYFTAYGFSHFLSNNRLLFSTEGDVAAVNMSVLCTKVRVTIRRASISVDEHDLLK